jgi:hypothetical protein
VIGVNTPTSDSFLGDGTQSSFLIPFPVYEYDSITVYVQDSLGAEAPLEAETDFLVDNIDLTDYNLALDLVDDGQAWIDGGNLKTGYTLFIEYTLSAFQPAVLRGLGSFAPVAIEKALDRITMAVKRGIDYLNESLSTFETVQDDVFLLKTFGYSAVIINTGGVKLTTAGGLYVIKTASDVTMNLPAAPEANQAVHFKRRGFSGLITIDAGASTIDGQSTFSLSSSESAVSIVYDGTEWIII